ncbi:LysR family transcriptional regulator [Vibrio harveyi]|uniref:LysR family transcriptional regulator n=1 Tax=Vibrio harveyi TaxID=669 RepID=UPI00237FEA71|nr:LysR family transcriptional regulator [Vibrio harveyi]HDM8057612.1 LysR family transcriptional regulator [Vibrio harveyi]
MNLITLIKSFICTVEEGSFTGASKKLEVSKSLVSRNVRDLETYLGTRLMNRSTKALSLTDAGHQYYQEAHVLILQLEALNDTMRFDSNEISGTLNVLAPNGLTEILLMPFICGFSDRYPELRVNLLLDDGLDDISSQGYDVAIRSGRLVRQDSDLIATKITENRNIICASPQYLEASSSLLQPRDLHSHRIIEDPNLKNYKVWRFNKAGKELDVQVSPSLSVNSVQAVKTALKQNYGVAMLPRALAEDELCKGELIEVLKDYQLPTRTVYALYRARSNTPRKVKVFIEELKAYFVP